LRGHDELPKLTIPPGGTRMLRRVVANFRRQDGTVVAVALLQLRIADMTRIWAT
jgi:hypothetical protein